MDCFFLMNIYQLELDKQTKAPQYDSRASLNGKYIINFLSNHSTTLVLYWFRLIELITTSR